MKKSLFIFLLAFAVPALFAQAEVSFSYTKQSGMASNQFAVWIEDAQGQYIKTLYATKYTAEGGWKRRELSIPLWVKQSNLPEMNKAWIDAITGPTPQSGTLRYTWNGTDDAGRTLAAGEYRVLVEATLRNENRVLYTAMIQLGEKIPASAKTTATTQTQYFGTGIKEHGMIGPVVVTY